jgi:unsaturated chondroitin disaccharide hydrolase
VQGLPEEARYRNAALAMLDSLSSPAYLATGTTHPGILLHGVGNLPAHQEVDVSLIYGDYYFIEALLRFKQRPMPAAAGYSTPAWYSKTSYRKSAQSLGSCNTGRQVVEFDLTPRRSPLEGYVGYADSSTDLTSRSRLAMYLRLNPRGFFDVRNGDVYTARTVVRYSAAVTYHVRMVADLGARRYSVWMTPPGGNPILLAENVAFRTSAPATDDLGKLAIVTSSDHELWVSNHTLVSAAYATSLGAAQAAASSDVAECATQPDTLPEENPPDGGALGCASVPGAGALALGGLLLWLVWAGRRVISGTIV